MFYLGIDVAKAKLDCCLALHDGRKKTKVVPNSTDGIVLLLKWLERHLPAGTPVHELHAVLEGTGVYHETCAHALHDACMVVSIVNPAQVRDFANALGVRSKNDGIDAHVLARYGMAMQPPRWTPAPVHVRELQALLSRREALVGDLQREHNRLEKAQAAHTVARVQDSLQTCIAFLTEQIQAIDDQIDQHIDHHPDLKGDERLLRTIPAVGPRVSRMMIGLLRSKDFHSAEQLAAYMGLVPVERQSGSSIRGKSRLSKAGPAKVRATLYMAAVVATRCNPQVKALYERLQQRGKTKMSALGAAMRKLVHVCFGVWKHQQPYRADYALNA